MSLQEQINALAAAKTPFVFCISYDKQDGFVYEKERLPKHIKIDMGEQRGEMTTKKKPSIVNRIPIDFKEYDSKIKELKKHIKDGDIYLANLTCETKVELLGTLDDIYEASLSKFRLLVGEKFVVSSPEEFVSIEDGKISTYPMKGTIAFSSQDRVKTLLENQKELAEHTMVVDLLRNDLSMVAERVRVERFRYPIVIKTGEGQLVQTISHITGKLPNGYEKKLGDILFALLPAGSITGTPKKKCIEILDYIEGYKRGFYCGIFGEFDGKRLTSAVAIRYIEKAKDGFVYKSGGGITYDSDARSEYEEMLKKVYLAF